MATPPDDNPELPPQDATLLELATYFLAVAKAKYPSTSETASPEPRGTTREELAVIVAEEMATASDCSNPNGQPQLVACSLPVLQSATEPPLQQLSDGEADMLTRVWHD